MSEALVICDLRPDWRRNPFVTFWRPDDAGYAFPLSWAGDYTPETVRAGGTYYTKHEDGKLIRFAVPRSVAEAMAVPPPDRMIDGNAGPVVPNNAQNRKKLLKAAHIPTEGVTA